jgi:hypothetical protein
MNSNYCGHAKPFRTMQRVHKNFFLVMKVQGKQVAIENEALSRYYESDRVFEGRNRL